MESKEIFSLGLNLSAPWFVQEVRIEKASEGIIMHIEISHHRRTKFSYEEREYAVYDHQERTWEHLSFFEHRCYLHARVPRIKLETGKVKLVEVPWAQLGSSFSLLYEYDVLKLVAEGMSASGVSRRLGIGSKRVFGMIRSHVSQALSTQGIAVVKDLSVDETSSKKGHHYLTIMSDRKEKKVVGVSSGKDKESFAHALVDMEIRGGDREQVRSVTMDMSRSYISSVAEKMPQADIVFDRFHIAKKMNESVDAVRKQDRKAYSELKNSRYLWLKNNASLSETQRTELESLSKACPNIGKAYRLKELLKIILDNAYKDQRIGPLNEWIKEAWKSGLEPIRKFVNMLRNHWYGIKGYFKRLATNAYAERVNLKIQEIKRVAKGYSNIHNFILMIYFHLGGLKLIPTRFV